MINRATLDIPKGWGGGGEFCLQDSKLWITIFSSNVDRSITEIHFKLLTNVKLIWIFLHLKIKDLNFNKLSHYFNCHVALILGKSGSCSCSKM